MHVSRGNPTEWAKSQLITHDTVTLALNLLLFQTAHVMFILHTPVIVCVCIHVLQLQTAAATANIARVTRRLQSTKHPLPMLSYMVSATAARKPSLVKCKAIAACHDV